MSTLTIAVDAMGGDLGPSVSMPAVAKALKTHPNLRIIVTGKESSLEPYLAKLEPELSHRLTVRHCEQVVAMDELPSIALRSKKQSSMRVAIELVKSGEAAGCVSAGNTGALMATARYVLKTLPGIERPAILAELPAYEGKTRVLDLGANVDSCAEHLYQFALMGSALIQVVDHCERPRIGLLNIGVEEIKGNDQVKQTAILLSEDQRLNYVGFVEGNDIFRGVVDLVVCDGFVGNVALKSCEGTAKLLVHHLKASFKRNLFNRLAGLIARPVLRQVAKKMDPSRYNGASFVGVNGVVVKSHGSANTAAFVSAIREAIRQANGKLPERIGQQLPEYT